MNYPKELYAIYDSSKCMNDIVLVTCYKDDVKLFMSQRNYNPVYKSAKITKKEHVKELYGYMLEHQLQGELVGGKLLTFSEFEYFSESYMQLSNDINYGVEKKILKQLPYLKLCDEDLEILIKFCKMIIDKMDSLYSDSPSEDDVIDEDKIFYIEKVADYFFEEHIL